MVTFPGYNMLLFSVLEPLYMPKCKMRSWRGLLVPLTGKTECGNRAARQINCRNVASAVLPTPCWPLKWRSSLGAGGKPPAQSCGLIMKATKLLIGEEWGRNGVIFTVRQYSVAALKDDSYSKSFIICRKCLLLTTLAERRNGSSCWPQPISYIIICLQDLLAKLGCFFQYEM